MAMTNHLDETVRIAALMVSPEPDLVLSLEPDELQGLRAITEVEAAGSGRDADLTQSAKTLMHAALEARLEELGLRWNPSPETVRKRAALTTRPAGPVIALMTNDRARKLVVSGLAVAALIVLWGGYTQGWTWTGFQGNEQLWDWLHLLLLPVVLGTLPLWIRHPEYMTRTRRLTYVTAAAAFAALVLAGYLVPLNWTGFPGNTLWDWIGLLLLPVAVASARFLPAVVRSLRPYQKWGIGTVAVAWALTIAGGYSWHWTWTGYQGNTLWDWLGLLLLPLLVPTVVLPTALRWVSANAPAVRQAAGAAPGGAWTGTRSGPRR
jgi:uncharacterized membrane protein